jgi:glycosyltransferase involved in cell wall biosynthesis
MITPKLRIGIAARGLNSHYSGPREYIEGFISAFVEQASPHQVFLYYDTRRFAGKFPLAHERVLPKTRYLFWDHIQLPYALKQDKIDIAIFPKGTMPLWRPCRSVPIILDLGYFHRELNAYRMLNSLYMRAALRYSAKHAWGIFTISQYTTDDVKHFFHIDDGKIQNIYGGVYDHYAPIVDRSILETVRVDYNLQSPFIFYPTSISPRKNINRVLDAFESIINTIPHHLYFTGKVSWNSAAVQKRLRGNLSKRVHLLGAVRPVDMPALYSLADFTIYPSLFEGLGLPILEAFKCGSPVLISDQTCLPEVAGDAAHIVEGYNTVSIANGLLQLATDNQLRASLINKGLERVKFFNWESTVKTALDWINTHCDVKE